jgi:septal ring factor EnvC (AmiA/AmiB activator)
MLRRFILSAAAIAALGGGLALAQTGSAKAEGEALVLAKRQAEQALLRSRQLEQEAQRATNEAAKARAAASAVAARIEAAEAELTAAETRIRIIQGLQARQRARLAERQEPVVQLTAALQTMARRPPALALVQPGSIDEVVHVRSVLASTLPIIRARTAGLRAEVEAGNALKKQAETARIALAEGREELRKQRLAFAAIEERQRRRSQELADSALGESDRALAFGEEARDLGAVMRTREYQERLRARLVQLPGPALRPGATEQSAARPPVYTLPVQGRLVTGTGEISEAGVHARGLTFAPAPNTEVVAPRSGRIVYAAPFRGYGRILIIDHGGGWTSLITDLAALTVSVGDQVERGQPIGRTGGEQSRVTVELRRAGRPVAIAPLIARS